MPTIPTTKERPVTKHEVRPLEVKADAQLDVNVTKGAPAQAVVDAMDVNVPARVPVSVPAQGPSSGTSKASKAANAGLAGMFSTAGKVITRTLAAALLGMALLSPVLADGPAHTPPMSSTSVRVMQAQPKLTVDVAPLASAMGLTEAELMKSVNYASVQVTVDEARTLDVAGGKLVIPKGTHIQASISEYGISVSTSPALVLQIDWRPDVTLEQLHYNFGDGKFAVTASGLGPDGIYTKFATDKANESLKPLMPKELLTPGFSPNDIGHVKMLMQTVASLTGSGDVAVPLSGWSASLEMTPPKAIHTELSPGISLDIPAKRPLELSVRTKLENGQTVLDGATLRALSSDVPVIKKGSSSFASLDLRSISLQANPAGSADAFKVTADYTLGAENGISGVIALFGAVIGAAHGASPEVGAQIALQRSGDVKLEAARKDVDAAIQKLSEPIAKLIGTLHHVVPGSGLGDV